VADPVLPTSKGGKTKADRKNTPELPAQDTEPLDDGASKALSSKGTKVKRKPELSDTVDERPVENTQDGVSKATSSKGPRSKRKAEPADTIDTSVEERPVGNTQDGVSKSKSSKGPRSKRKPDAADATTADPDACEQAMADEAPDEQSVAGSSKTCGLKSASAPMPLMDAAAASHETGKGKVKRAKVDKSVRLASECETPVAEPPAEPPASDPAAVDAPGLDVPMDEAVAPEDESVRTPEFIRTPEFEDIHDRYGVDFRTPGVDHYYVPTGGVEHLQLDGPVRHMSFVVRAEQDAHVGLFPRELAGGVDDSGAFYEIVLGARGNSRSSIRRSKNGANEVLHTGGVLQALDYREFWASVDEPSGRVAVGQGRYGEGPTLMEFTDQAVMAPVSFAVMTRSGSGRWCFQKSEDAPGAGAPSAGTEAQLALVPLGAPTLREDFARFYAKLVPAQSSQATREVINADDANETPREAREVARARERAARGRLHAQQVLAARRDVQEVNAPVVEAETEVPDEAETPSAVPADDAPAKRLRVRGKCSDPAALGA